MRKSPVSSRKELHVDPVAEELQWWALGGYPAVLAGMRRRGEHWSRVKAEKRIKYLIGQQYAITGNPLWQPQSSQAFEELRAKIRVGESLEDDLM